MSAGFVDFFSFPKPKEKFRPVAFNEKGLLDCGGGVKAGGFSTGAGESCCLLSSMEEGAVDVALKREELSVVEVILEVEPPLPLNLIQMLVKIYETSSEKLC